MWSSDSDSDFAAGGTAITTASSSTCSSNPSTPPLPSPPQPPPRRHKNIVGVGVAATGREAEAEDVWPRRPKPVVVAAEETDSTGAASSPCGNGVGRARSLTDDDLEELKGCADLGFGFSYEEIPELCGTLPALELCYSMSQRFLDQPQAPQEQETAATPTSPPIANWKISSPGDSTEEVKARLKYWAQAVACTVRLCRLQLNDDHQDNMPCQVKSTQKCSLCIDVLSRSRSIHGSTDDRSMFPMTLREESLWMDLAAWGAVHPIQYFSWRMGRIRVISVGNCMVFVAVL